MPFERDVEGDLLSARGRQLEIRGLVTYLQHCL